MEYDTLSIPILFVGYYREKKCAKFIEKSVMTENTPFITVFFCIISQLYGIFASEITKYSMLSEEK